MKRKKSSLIAGIFFIVLFAVYLVLSLQLPESKLLDIGPGFMPVIYAVIGMVLAVTLMVQGIREGDVETAEESESKSEYLLVLFSFLLLLAYVMLLKSVGFVIMTALYLFFQMMVLAPVEKRNGLLFGVIGIACSLIIFYVFRRGFEIMLPVGILKFLK